MCSGSEADSHVRLIDFVYHSTLGLRVIKKKKKLFKRNTRTVFSSGTCSAEAERTGYGVRQSEQVMERGRSNRLWWDLQRAQPAEEERVPLERKGRGAT